MTRPIHRRSFQEGHTRFRADLRLFEVPTGIEINIAGAHGLSRRNALRRIRRHTRAQKPDNTWDCLPHIAPALSGRFVHDVDESVIVHTAQNVEDPIVVDARFGAILARRVELDPHVARECSGLADALHEVGIRQVGRYVPAGPRRSGELPAIQDEGQIRMIDRLDEVEHFIAGAAQRAVIVILQTDG